jgi:predicted GIY-YIG superfamily endonuclease
MIVEAQRAISVITMALRIIGFIRRLLESIHYSGVTRDLDARLIKHNQKKCIHTSKHRPWPIETAIV